MSKKTSKNSAIEMPTTSNSWSKWFPYLLGLITFFVYLNSIQNGYNLDDELVTRNHPLTSKGLSAIWEIITSPYYSDNMGYSYGYRPMVHLSFAIEHEIFGENVMVSHSINLILYIICVLLFFNLLLKWVGNKNQGLAIIAVLFFAVHPIHTEVVASIKNRDEILSFLFVVFSAINMFKYIERNKPVFLIIALFSIVIAILSKKSTIPLVLIIPLFSIATNNLSLKKVVIITSTLVIPAIIIASELSFLKFSLLFFVFYSIIFSFFYLKNLQVQNSNELKPLFKNKIFPIIFILSCLILVLFLNKFFLVFFVIIGLIWLVVLDINLGLIFFLLTSNIFGFHFAIPEFFKLALFVSLFYFFNFPKKERIKITIIILFFLSFISLSYVEDPLTTFISSILFALTSYLSFKYRWYGLIFAVFIFSLNYFIEFEFNTRTTIVLFMCVLFSLIKVKYPTKGMITLALIYFSFLSLNMTIQTFNYEQKKFYLDHSYNIKNLPTKANESKSILNEGRVLQYVENTLVKHHTVEESLGTGFNTIWVYSKLMVFPNELSFYYGFSKTKTEKVNSLVVWFSILFHLGLVFLAVWQFKHRIFITVGIVWYLSSILLFSNWFELVAGMVGERLAFTASAGFSIFIASLIFRIKPNFNFKKPSLVEISFLIVIILFSIKTIQRNSQWKDPLTLMGNDIKHLQNSAQANNLFALNLMKISTSEEGYSEKERLIMQKNAALHFKKAVKIYPKFENAWFDLGRSASIIGDTITAIKGFENSISLNPQNLDAYYLLLNLFEIKSRWDKHLKYSLLLFEINKDPSSSILLSNSYIKNNKQEKAIYILKKANERYPFNSQIKTNYSFLIENSH